ncbi:polysaccharide deacetylase family sporulation protein PdaB [Cerasibacillus terrae]|uniref:Polysaccharide deacetylase family sporulation protein PdaB n=1 Tax=Cerasibacillus terrae TaxID=2498845 RepID=A0A5C8NHG4_9BACI|nr:polysaccharide deacetylase family sporulation protein PdaB [Cerasibacillus terrae]TXL57824.1 polysaccharide deacetylase family sporulation protein PdaB [Cerasibacillus terrae]
MNHFYVWRLDKLKYVGLIIILLALAITYVLVGQGKSLFVFSNEPSSVFVKGNNKENGVALTFNISWGEEKVHDILKELKKHDVRTTFFVSGEWAERHPEIVEKIVEAEHELGMLGYHYKSYLEQDVDQVRRDLLQAKEIFKKLGYSNVELLRTPNGHFNEEVVELAESLDLKVVQWNVNPNDWKNPGSEYIVDTVMKDTSKGDIILLHASDAVKQTANALQTLLPGLKKKGFEFITISQMMNQAQVEAKLVE